MRLFYFVLSFLYISSIYLHSAHKVTHMYVGIGAALSHQLVKQRTIGSDQTSSGQAISGYQTENETNGLQNLGYSVTLGIVSKLNQLALGCELNVSGDFFNRSNNKKRSIAESGTYVWDETDSLLLVSSKNHLDGNFLINIGPKHNKFFYSIGLGVGRWQDRIKVINVKNNGEKGNIAGNTTSLAVDGDEYTHIYNLRTSYQEKGRPVNTKQANGYNFKSLPAIVIGVGLNAGKKHMLSVRMLYKQYFGNNKIKVIAYDDKDKSQSVLITHDEFHSRKNLSLICQYQLRFN